MISIEVLMAFMLATAVICLVPGPDNLYVLNQSAQHGASAGIYVTLGLCTGLVGHTAAVTLGIATLLQTSVWGFTVLKILGAAYLLYLAWQLFHAAQLKVSREVEVLAPRTLYLRGVWMNLTNPKVTLFFLAFLPQFISSSQQAVWSQTMLLGFLVIVTTLVVFSTIALLASWLGKWLCSEVAQKRLNRLTSGLFVILALNLLVATP
ncbi:LysE family translocator [Thiomicrorhabdus sp. zzn3]|uniref:LysE family translocator n=1 Tax=Thiomicrorhabdus sp. zzn3 TaxID=3039775 RepID=UPI002436AA2D|nr:LysE family translocator [Thiomicrorhabdus sp. zzn3]MDG6778677.1 LysE family translocator [Thiomicrorhabdus sp. zzn3]